jgi:hypothetical protein
VYMKTWFKGSEVEDIRLSGKRVYNRFLINILRPFVNDCDLFSKAKTCRLCNTVISVQVPTSMTFLERLASVGEM